MLQQLLSDRKVPLVTAKDAESMQAAQKEYKEILLREEYGTPVPEPDSVSSSFPLESKFVTKLLRQHFPSIAQMPETPVFSRVSGHL